jgi:hypothetical protein
VATRTPTRPEDEEIHGERQPEPIFSPNYDPQKTPLGDSSDPRGDTSRSSPDDLRSAEESPQQPSGDTISDQEKGLTGSGSSKGHIGYRSGDKFSPTSRLGKLGHKLKRNKKKVAAGGIVGAITGVSFYGLGIISGPLQLVHLSQVLRGSLFSMERDKQTRGAAMIRYWKTGDIGQTRLTFVGSRIAGNAVQRLERNGVRFVDRNPASGRPGAAEFRTDRHPDTRGQSLTADEQRRAIARASGVPLSEVRLDRRLTPQHRIFRVNTPPGSNGINTTDRILRSGLETTKWLRGKFITPTEHRTLKRLYGIPRLFSPIQKSADIKERFTRWAISKEEKAKERRNERKGRAANYRGPVATKVADAKQAFRNRPNIAGQIGQGLYITAGTCIARNVAGSVAIANRAAVVAPSVIEATHYTAVGDQVKSGKNAYIEQYGLEADFLQDENGNTIWEAKGMNALSDPRAKGTDLDPQYKQAFSNKDVEQDIKDKFDVKVAGVSIGGLACSDPGLVAQALVSATFTGLSCSTGVGCVAAAGKFIGSSIAAAVALAFLSGELVDALAEGELDLESLPAEQRGNVLAYAAREGANINARSSGGTMLSDSDRRAMESEQRFALQQEFQSEDWVARIFGARDHRSLVSRTIIQKSSPDPSQNLANIASGLTDFGSSIAAASSGLLSALIPNVLAQEPYNWNFPKYGVPRSVFNAPRYADPYANAEKTAAIFGDNEDHKLIKRAKKCFGAEIKKDSNNKWTAISQEDVNPAESEYHKANCNENNENWRRVQMFVFDSRLVDSMACLEEDSEFSSESCSNLAVDSTATPSTPSGSISGTAQELAQRVVDNGNIIKSGRYVLEDLQNTADGKPAYGSVKLDIGILQFLLEAAKHGAITVTSISGEGSGHSPGSNHYSGIAIDLGCTGVGNQVELLNKIAAKYKGKNNGERCDRPNPYGYDPHDHYDFSN